MAVTTIDREARQKELIAQVEAAVRERGGDLSRRETKFRCPETAQHANGDAHPSASWNTAKQTWKCHVCGAGGGYVDLARRLGILDPPRTAKKTGGRRTVYAIRGPDGAVVAEHVRIDYQDGTKDMPWRRNGKSGLGGMSVEALPLYGTHELKNALKGGVVIVTEGEKARDALTAKGIAAVGTVTGADQGKKVPSLDSWRVLAGHTVVLWPDNDEPGFNHMALAAEKLRQLGITPRAFVWTDAPNKADAFDWFSSGRTVDELRELLAAAPPWTIPATGGHQEHEEAPTDQGGSITWMDDLLKEPDEEVEWIVEGLLPAGGTSIIAAKPKVGKSTTVRHLALAVSRGESFLGRTTQPGPVLYIAHEGRRADIKAHLRQLGNGSGSGPLATHVGPVPRGVDPVAWLRDLIVTHGFKLVIIDTIGRFAGLRDANDYAEVTRATGPLIALANETGCHIMCVHHSPKGGRSGTDAVLGSTAFSGAFDSVLVMKRGSDQTRTMETVQRVGTDLPETVVTLDKNTGRVALAGRLEDIQLAQTTAAIVAVIGPEIRTEPEIRKAVGADSKLVGKALRAALENGGPLRRTGTGKRGDAFRYFRRDETVAEEEKSLIEEATNRAIEHSSPSAPDAPTPDALLLYSSIPPSDTATNGSQPPQRQEEEPPSRAKVIQLAVEAFGAEVRRRSG